MEVRQVITQHRVMANPEDREPDEEGEHGHDE